MTEEEQVAADKKRAQLIELETNEHVRALLETYGGRYFMWELLGKCGVYAGTFRGADTHQSAFEEGRRSIGLEQINKIFASNPQAYALMRIENQRREHDRRQQEPQDDDHGIG